MLLVHQYGEVNSMIATDCTIFDLKPAGFSVSC